MNQQLITIKFATSKLEMLANRLWKSGEPHDLDYVYGRIWLHSLELAHYFGSATAEEYLRGLNIKYQPKQGLSVPLKVSVVISDGCAADELMGRSGENKDRLQSSKKLTSNTTTSNNAVVRCQTDDEKDEAAVGDMKLKFSKPGSLRGDRIMSLIKVPLDRFAHDKNLLTLYQSIQSDQVRLLWLDTSEDDKTLPGLPPLRSPALFYVPPLEENLRSLPGPLRRQRMKRWRVYRSSSHSRSNYIEKAKKRLLQQRNYSLARWLRETSVHRVSSTNYLSNPDQHHNTGSKNPSSHSIVVSNKSTTDEELRQKLASDLNLNRNSSTPVLHIGGSKMVCLRGSKDRIKSSMSDAHLNKISDTKSAGSNAVMTAEQIDATKERKEALSTSYLEHQNARPDSSKTSSSSRLSTPASVPNFSSNYFAPKVQPMPYFLFYPTKPQPVVLQTSPWIVRTPGRPMLARMMPTQVLLPGFRPLSVSRPAVVRMQQCNTKCSPPSMPYPAAVGKISVDSTTQAFHMTRFQIPLKQQNGCFTNQTAPPRIISLKADQGTQTEVAEDSLQQKAASQKIQKLSDLKVSLVHFPSQPIHANLGFPVGMPHFRNFGMNCFPFVQLTHLSNNAV